MAIRTPSNDWIIVEVKHYKPKKIQDVEGNDDILKTNEQVRVLNFEAGPVTPPGVPSGEIPPKILYPAGRKSLETNIERAFKQIVQRKYTAPYLGSAEKVYAATVAIYDSSDVMIRFRRVVWKDQAKEQIEIVAGYPSLPGGAG
jgi:hypothetical protein